MKCFIDIENNQPICEACRLEYLADGDATQSDFIEWSANELHDYRGIKGDYTCECCGYDFDPEGVNASADDNASNNLREDRKELERWLFNQKR